MKTAFLFAGQGSQYPGMGRDLGADSVYDEANHILGYDLKDICFSGPPEKLVQTKYSQPAILVTSIAFLKGIKTGASAAAGLSLGEYTALIYAGALSFEDGLRLVERRASFMQEAQEQCDGGMASVIGAGEDDVRKVIEDNGGIIDIANLNCPGQVVVSGLKKDIDALTPLFKERGAKKVIPLNVSGPFHSRYMEPAGKKLEPFIRNTPIKCPSVRFFANASGAETKDPDTIKENLIKQVSSAVYWERSVRNMLAAGIDSFMEIGPGNVLSGFMRRINKEVKKICN